MQLTPQRAHSSSHRKDAPEPNLLAPAFCFSVHFSYPLRPLALAAAKHCEADPAAVKGLTSGLMEGARELEFDGDKLGKVIELVRDISLHRLARH